MGIKMKPPPSLTWIKMKPPPESDLDYTNPTSESDLDYRKPPPSLTWITQNLSSNFTKPGRKTRGGIIKSISK